MERADSQIRLLLVDDDPQIRRSLTRLLKRYEVFETQSAGGGPEALEMLARQPFDMVVSDVQMPDMTGYELLKKVRSVHPAIVRVILSGTVCQPEGVGLVHQYWTKPWETQSMLDSLQRTARVVKLFQGAEWRAEAGQIESLPAAPAVARRLSSMIEDPHTSAQDLAEVIATDPAIAAKILQLANSAFFGPSGHTLTLNEAVVRLGMRTIRGLAVAAMLYSKLPVQPDCLDVNHLQSTSLFIGQLASQMLTDPRARETALVAGLLRGIGQLIVASRAPQKFSAMIAEAKENGRPLPDIELTKLGVTHADLGAYLLGIWGLPWEIVDAVAQQYHSQPSPPRAEDAAGAVRIATSLVLGGREPGFESQPIDLAWLGTLNVGERFEEWRTLIGRLMSSKGPVRHLPRAIVQWAATFRIGASIVVGAARDVNDKGIFIAADWPVEPGTQVRINLELPTGENLTVNGVVRWRGRSATHQCDGFGVDLDDSEPTLAEYICSLVSNDDVA